MARMIAADDERGWRKVMPPRNRQTTVTGEKHSAKSLKDGTTRSRRQEHLLCFPRIRHWIWIWMWMSSVVFALVIGRASPTPEGSPRAVYCSADCDVEQSGRRWFALQRLAYREQEDSTLVFCVR